MKGIVIHLILVFLIYAHSFGQKENTAQNLTLKLDSIIIKHTNSSEFMGTVLIARNGIVQLKKGYGLADLDLKTPNTPETNYCIASITKLFTYSAINLLNDKGLLKMNDPLSKYIPDYPMGDSITIRNLFENTSGIVDFINERPYVFYKEEVSLEKIISQFKSLPLNFKPGNNYSYSNSGWILLAYIIEKVSGLKYADFIDKNIFEKAGMKSSFPGWEKTPKYIAKGYYTENGKYIQFPWFHPSQFLGCGNISSTVEDLYRWYESIYKAEKDCFKYQFRFNGKVGGYRSILFIDRTIDCVYVLLSNNQDAPLDEMVDELDQVELKFNNLNVVTDSVEKYKGYYFAGDKYALIVENENDRLVFHSFSTDNNTIDHYPGYLFADNQFINSNMSFTFNNLEGEKYQKIIASWGCSSYPYKRAIYVPDTSNVIGYLGRFKLDNGNSLTVSNDNKNNLIMEFKKADLTGSRFIIMGATKINFVFPFGRLIFSGFENSKYQKVKVFIDGEFHEGKRVDLNNTYQ